MKPPISPSVFLPFYCMFCLQGDPEYPAVPPNTPEPVVDIMDHVRNLERKNTALEDEIKRLKSQMMTIREFHRMKVWGLHKALGEVQKRARLISEQEVGE